MALFLNTAAFTSKCTGVFTLGYPSLYGCQHVYFFVHVVLLQARLIVSMLLDMEEPVKLQVGTAKCANVFPKKRSYPCTRVVITL